MSSAQKPKRRVGIYAGSFDPIHAGHIAFALQAVQAANLDAVFFLPERRPRHKEGVEHFGHRVAMIRRATAPHPQFGVLELVDVHFSVERTLPELMQQFPAAQLVFLFGSDAIIGMNDWPNVERLLQQSELVVGLRTGVAASSAQKLIASWNVQPKRLTLFSSYAPHVSSTSVREGLRHRTSVPGLLRSVQYYSERNWLYISLV